MFHFLTDAADRERYNEVLHQALSEDGQMVIATFAADGPKTCSGLPTTRYSPDGLAAQFPGFDMITSVREEHRTPTDRVQPFTWLAMRRRS